MKEVKIRCSGAMSLALESINDFQGSLKDLSVTNYEKLRGVIEKHGFSEPISVWKDMKTNKFMCLNGHQRLRVLKLMAKEGYVVPKLPVNLVEAVDFKEAREKVLTLTSQYGEITQQGLYEFMSESGTDWEWAKASLRLPEVNFEHFERGFLGIDQGGSSTGAVDMTNQNFTGDHVCPKCGFTFNESMGGARDEAAGENSGSMETE